MDDLLELALDSPEEARGRAEAILQRSSDRLEQSFARQALGIVLRNEGDTNAALEELRRAVSDARLAASVDRERDARATYGVTLVISGRPTRGLAELTRALDGARGEIGAKIRMRMAGALTILGRYSEGAAEMRIALRDISGTRNALWEARTRIWLGYLEFRLGNLEEADAELIRADHLLEGGLSPLERLAALENRAEVALGRGDLATALRMCRQVIEGYRPTGESPPPVFLELFAEAYLAAGLASDAAALLSTVDSAALQPTVAAQYQMTYAEVLMASGDAHGALEAAQRAHAMFRAQQRSWFVLRAELTLLQARELVGDRRGIRERAAKVATCLDAEGAVEAPVALVLAGRLGGGLDRTAMWKRAASYRRRPNALVRAGAWLAQALERGEVDDHAGVLRAAKSGLDAIDEHRRLLGSSELRALATTHGRELTTIALRHAAHDPRTLLRWSERTRATALAQPPATSDAATIPASLAALRVNGRKLAEARQAGEPTDELDRERLRLERAVRSEHHTLSARAEEAQRPASAEEVVAGVGAGCLVELVEVDGVLHVLVVHDGRVRRRVAGTTADAAELLGPTAMLLRRASRGRPADTTDLGRRLQETILGDAARLIPDGPVVLAPTARLHGLPWAVLPALRDRPFSVVPSAGQWLRAQAVRRPRARRTVLVAGPALASGGAEVPILAERLPDAELLDGPAATVHDVLDRIDGADLVHLATHGHFRADSPLFSALDLADGPLTVHDLERVPRAPYRVVLSACESGVLAPVGAEELLGLAAALFSLGTAGLVCSVAEVNDAATAELMVGLHDGLARGLDPAQALLPVRQNAADPVLAGTAASFVALGV